MHFSSKAQCLTGIRLTPNLAHVFSLHQREPIRPWSFFILSEFCFSPLAKLNFWIGLFSPILSNLNCRISSYHTSLLIPFENSIDQNKKGGLTFGTVRTGRGSWQDENWCCFLRLDPKGAWRVCGMHGGVCFLSCGVPLLLLRACALTVWWRASPQCPECVGGVCVCVCVCVCGGGRLTSASLC